MKDMLSDFEKEQNDLLSFVLNERFFKTWQEDDAFHSHPESSWDDTTLELYLTSTCNQNCEYCYLVKYDLYPQEYNKPDLILHNLAMIYDWVIENKFHIKEAEFFSGEIWHAQFGLDVLELTYQYLLKGMQIGVFVIPSNCSFIFDDNQTLKLQNYIDKFESIGHRIMFSISVDGLIIDQEERPMNNGKVRDEEYYDKLFAFAYHNNYYFHPMLSAHSVNRWIENYQWWMKKLAEYEFPPEAMMLLEVRNNEWTEQNLKDFSIFLEYLIDEEVKRFNGDVKTYVLSHFNGDLRLNDLSVGYTPINLAPAEPFPPCSIAQALTVRVGDLAIAPCHRTSYNKLMYGWFETENNKIVGIKQNNVYNAIRVLLVNSKAGHIKCDSCLYSDFCLKGCFGAQYENNDDMFMPIENICDMAKVKWQTIIHKLQKIGALEYLKEVNSYAPHFQRVLQFMRFAQGVLSDVG